MHRFRKPAYRKVSWVQIPPPPQKCWYDVRMSENGHKHRLIHDPATRRSRIRSFKAKIDARRNIFEKIADLLTASFGTVSFLIFNAAVFAFWLAWNTDHVPGLSPIDPYPFGLLTTVVSLEAIFLSVIVLISQNREARVTELREEVELYINTYSENEITKVIHILARLAEKNGIDLSHDAELDGMLRNIESDEIENELERQLAVL